MARFDFIISRRSDSDVYELWRADIDGPEFLSPVAINPQARFNPAHQIAQIGSYLLEWGPMMLETYQPSFPYRLFKFDPASPDPLAGRAVQKGLWSRSKFWAYRPDFANPNGASEGYNAATDLRLLPLGGFMLNVIAMAGRATYHLWNFDPNPMSQSDPLAAPYTPQGGFDSIQQGNELIAMGNYVLDRVAATGDYRVWSFDPMGQPPLAQPPVQQGRWSDITAAHRLVAMGEHVLDWTPADRQYRLWAFDPAQANPLVGPVRSGPLPEGFDAHTTLLTVQPPLPLDKVRAEQPGTMDFMRSKIKHVVYLMLENRSFDHLLGWLYEKDQPATFVGHDQPFAGASEAMFNIDPTQNNQKVHLQAYKNGATSETWDTTDFLPNDPYHDKSDVLRQYFFDNRNGYVERAKPDMGGFVWNNGVPEVMWTYKPQQLPVINGLAKSFAVSDEWFSSMPGATDPNRAMAFTGSAQQMLNNWQNGNIYTYWADFPRRASIWKTLWTQGITDFKLYHSVEWLGFIHTYHLYLEGQVPTIDKNKERFLSDIDTFKAEALLGKLPAFSLLEPAWIAPVGTTSYHPGADLIPGERALNEIYESVRAGPAWNETLFIITFDEHGGIFDHVPPPYAANPWPNDVNDGFAYDMLGVRVPMILVSPWIKESTVFRAGGEQPFDATSTLATLLQWFGVPRSRWAMGDRVQKAPSFERVFQRSTPRDDAPATFTVPSDVKFPAQSEADPGSRVSDLQHLMLPYLVQHLARQHMNPQEADQVAKDILAEATDLPSLYAAVDRFAKGLM